MLYRCAKFKEIMTITTTPITAPSEGEDPVVNQKDEVWHWMLIAVFVLICAIGAIGNGLVIYVVTQKPKRGPFRHLNKVVRNLGITDFLFALVAAPLVIVYWTWCKICARLEYSGYIYIYKD